MYPQWGLVEGLVHIPSGYEASHMLLSRLSSEKLAARNRFASFLIVIASFARRFVMRRSRFITSTCQSSISDIVGLLTSSNGFTW